MTIGAILAVWCLASVALALFLGPLIRDRKVRRP